MAKDQASIFLSHKARDAEAAKTIKRVLEDRSGRLSVRIFGEQAAGRPYEDWIEDQLSTCDLLLLLYTDPTAEWDWCLYEAGWFTPLGGESRRPVICLHTEGEAPKPLQRLVSVKGEPVDIRRKLLEPLFKGVTLVDVEPPLNSNISDQSLDEGAGQIATALGPQKLEERFYLERVMVNIPDPSVLQDGKIPDAVEVEALDAKLDILEFHQKEFTWRDLRERSEPTRGHGTYWLDEVEEAIVLAADRRPPRVLTGTFRELRGGRIFRPILYRMDWRVDTPCKFYIAFNEEVEPELVGGPGTVGLAFNLLRFASRFRWEVIVPFTKRFQGASTDEDLKMVFGQMKQTVGGIEDEARRHRQLVRDRLPDVYTPQVWPQIQEMLACWEGVRMELATNGRDIPGRENLLGTLKQLDSMCSRFMVFTVDAYRELLRKEVGAGAAVQVDR